MTENTDINEINDDINDNNPFGDDTDQIHVNEFVDIEIWIDARGRNKNTYVTGWNIEESVLKNHLKMFKTKHGCNGSVKKRGGNLIMQLQGDNLNAIRKFIIDSGISIELIKIRGVS